MMNCNEDDICDIILKAEEQHNYEIIDLFLQEELTNPNILITAAQLGCISVFKHLCCDSNRLEAVDNNLLEQLSQINRELRVYLEEKMLEYVRKKVSEHNSQRNVKQRDLEQDIITIGDLQCYEQLEFNIKEEEDTNQFIECLKILDSYKISYILVTSENFFNEFKILFEASFFYALYLSLIYPELIDKKATCIEKITVKLEKRVDEFDLLSVNESQRWEFLKNISDITQRLQKNVSISSEKAASSLFFFINLFSDTLINLFQVLLFPSSMNQRHIYEIVIEFTQLLINRLTKKESSYNENMVSLIKEMARLLNIELDEQFTREAVNNVLMPNPNSFTPFIGLTGYEKISFPEILERKKNEDAFNSGTTTAITTTATATTTTATTRVYSSSARRRLFEPFAPSPLKISESSESLGALGETEDEEELHNKRRKTVSHSKDSHLNLQNPSSQKSKKEKGKDTEQASLPPENEGGGLFRSPRLNFFGPQITFWNDVDPAYYASNKEKKSMSLVDTTTSYIDNDSSFKIIKTAIEDGNDYCILDITEDLAHQRDPHGNTLLYYAFVYRRLEYIKALTNKGAKIESNNNEGRTPFHCLKIDETNDPGHFFLWQVSDLFPNHFPQQLMNKMLGNELDSNQIDCARDINELDSDHFLHFFESDEEVEDAYVPAFQR